MRFCNNQGQTNLPTGFKTSWVQLNLSSITVMVRVRYDYDILLQRIRVSSLH